MPRPKSLKIKLNAALCRSSYPFGRKHPIKCLVCVVMCGFYRFNHQLWRQLAQIYFRDVTYQELIPHDPTGSVSFEFSLYMSLLLLRLCLSLSRSTMPRRFRFT